MPRIRFIHPTDATKALNASLQWVAKSDTDVSQLFGVEQVADPVAAPAPTPAPVPAPTPEPVVADAAVDVAVPRVSPESARPADEPTSSGSVAPPGAS